MVSTIKDANWRRFTEPSPWLPEPGAEDPLSRPGYAVRGFLPVDDPLRAFPSDSDYALLDEIGRDLPSLLEDRSFRQYARAIDIPPWTGPVNDETLPVLRLYYVRVGFLASAYVNQVGVEPAHRLPANLAVPLAQACDLLQRPPILSYDGYALYNWKRFNPARGVELGNIETLQNFVHLYDEHWFILVHVEIEAIAARILAAIRSIRDKLSEHEESVGEELWAIESAVRRQVEVLKRIPEKMDPGLYYKTFRPYIRFFENVVYEGVEREPIQFRGETGAQSSIMPTLVAFMKIPHAPSMLTDHLADMRHYMPAEHRALIDAVSALPSIRSDQYKAPFNAILDAIAEFREVHYGWANEYIQKRTDDPRGTGGTPYMRWLRQLIQETLAHKIA